MSTPVRSSRQVVLDQISEKEWQGWVVLTARTFGWLVYHTLDSRGSEAGFPDLVLVRDDELVFAELKRQRGKTTVAQERWADALQATGAEWHLWRPADQDAVLDRLRSTRG